MTGPVNTIVDRIPIAGLRAFEYFNNTLYCTGSPARRIDLRNKEVKVIGPPGVGSNATALVDFHRPFDVPPDVVGSGAPDGRIYMTTNSLDHVVEFIPPLLDQFTGFKVAPDSAHFPAIFCMVASHSGEYLYVHDWNTLAVGIVEVGPYPRMLGAIQLDHQTSSMVISPDDRFIYAAHPYNNFVSVIDTTAWPLSVRKAPVVNGPFGLALSADGSRLFVAQDGNSGTGDPSDLHAGTLSVFDTATMHGFWLYTGAVSMSVAVNSAGTRAYVSNNSAGTVSVVNVSSTLEVIDTITGFVSPTYVRISDDDTRLYVLESLASTGIAIAAV
jgi:DNA-binding beta-propeller fold protein YncE